MEGVADEEAGCDNYLAESYDHNRLQSLGAFGARHLAGPNLPTQRLGRNWYRRQKAATAEEGQEATQKDER